MVLSLWAAASLFLVATLSVSHLATYPLPEELQPLANWAQAQRTDAGRRLVVHLIPETCSCTDGLFKHLLARGPLPDMDERIVFIDPASHRHTLAARAGYRFATVGAEDVTMRLDVTAAPLLLVVDERDALIYAGGYFDHPAAVDPLDLDVLSALARNEAAPALPIFGCAVDDELRRAVDPLRLTASR